MVEFGEQLRRAREEKGMTQQSLAEQLYVTRQAVSRWECGDRYPDLLTTKKISQILEMSLDDLLSGKEMEKVVEFLQKNSVQYLATVGRDGKAKCRPFMFCFEQDGKLWFCTNNTKDVYKDMLANPEVEVSVSSPEYAWIRLHGKAVFEDNKSVKEGCMNNPIVKGQYQTADNPIFEVFYLENPHGLIADFSGNPPYEF